LGWIEPSVLEEKLRTASTVLLTWYFGISMDFTYFSALDFQTVLQMQNLPAYIQPGYFLCRNRSLNV